jgi:phage-related protein
MNEKKVKALSWIASSKKDLMDFPLKIRKEMGHALYIAQEGGKHKNAKPLKGFKGASVLEIVEDDGNGTYRTMYTVQFEEIVYVLHAFQKKSKTGIKTTKQDIDLLEARLKAAQQKYKEWLTSQKRQG